MTTRRIRLLDELPQVAEAVRELLGVLSGDLAAHVYLAQATGSRPGEPPRYSALPPHHAEALFPEGTSPCAGVHAATGSIAEAIRDRLSFATSSITLLDGTEVPVLSREAILAQLLGRGGLAIGLAGALVRIAGRPPVDIDDVRDILKAARQADRFQPMLELLDVA